MSEKNIHSGQIRKKRYLLWDLPKQVFDTNVLMNALKKSTRLHYLDWLRVAATLGVFLLHTMLPFDEVNWFVNNAEQSSMVTVARVLLVQFGMPLFFLLAGAGSWFALRRRSRRQFISERFRRLVVPFAVSAHQAQVTQLWRLAKTA